MVSGTDVYVLFNIFTFIPTTLSRIKAGDFLFLNIIKMYCDPTYNVV